MMDDTIDDLTFLIELIRRGYRFALSPDSYSLSEQKFAIDSLQQAQKLAKEMFVETQRLKAATPKPSIYETYRSSSDGPPKSRPK